MGRQKGSKKTITTNQTVSRFSPRPTIIRVVQMGYCAVLGISPQSLEGWGVRGYHNLALAGRKPRKWTIQTHSFSKHPKKIESSKYKYFLARRKLEGNRKFPEIREIWAISGRILVLTGKFLFTSLKKYQENCVIFFTYLNTFLWQYIWHSTTKQYFQQPEIMIFQNVNPKYDFGVDFEPTPPQNRSQNHSRGG